jgi:hypothetical protein
MRIAYAARPSSANGYYRAIGPMTALADVRGHRVRVLPVESNHNQPAEVVESGAAVVWDNDDDLGSMPKSVANHREWAGFAWQRRLGDMKRLFRFTDLVTTPSAWLAEKLRGYGAPQVEVIENYVPDEFAQPISTPQHRGVTIGWVAGMEHQMDVERIPIRAALQRLLDEREDVIVASLGLGLGLRSPRYHAIDNLALLDMAGLVAQFDIGIAPIADL